MFVLGPKAEETIPSLDARFYPESSIGQRLIRGSIGY
jgi:hypothetical protein